MHEMKVLHLRSNLNSIVKPTIFQLIYSNCADLWLAALDQGEFAKCDCIGFSKSKQIHSFGLHFFLGKCFIIILTNTLKLHLSMGKNMIGYLQVQSSFTLLRHVNIRLFVVNIAGGLNLHENIYIKTRKYLGFFTSFIYTIGVISYWHFQ